MIHLDSVSKRLPEGSVMGTRPPDTPLEAEPTSA
jgi:hypothetical protein